MIQLIKQAALDAVENGKPADLRFGTVDSINPLKVRISSDFILPESLLIVPQHLTDYSTEVNAGGASIDVSVVGDTLYFSNSSTHADGNTDESAIESVDERTLTVYNALAVGDMVVLLRNHGGTKYLILDRV